MRSLGTKLNHGLLTIQCVLIVALGLLALAPASAHEIQPAIADIDFSTQGQVDLVIETNLEALIAEIGPEHEDTNASPNASRYDGLRTLSPSELEEAFEGFEAAFLSGLDLRSGSEQLSADITELEIAPVGDLDLARMSKISLTAPLPADASDFVFAWAPQFGAAVIRVEAAGEGGEIYSAFVQQGEASEPLDIAGPAPRSFVDIVIDYIVIGFTHIVPKGVDHILFVIGIFLASIKLAPLLWQVSAFTVAHTVSLALGILGIVQISPAIVEPLIALSIAYVCVENILFKKMSPWRPAIVFAFGLLHGLGFAGVLGEVGLPTSEFVTGLISFNVGVELGQLFVIAICFALVGFWLGNKPYYRKLVVVPASLLIGAIGLYWFVERIVAG